MIGDRLVAVNDESVVGKHLEEVSYVITKGLPCAYVRPWLHPP